VGSIDFDAARAEAKEEPHEVTVGGRVYHLRAKLPPAVIEFLAPEDFDPQHPEEMSFVPRFSEVARALLVDPDADPLTFAVQLDDQEWEQLLSLYGFALGESSASPGSSEANGEQSRPTSPSTSELISPGSSAEI
jgi:hypothetical protein